MKLEFNLELDTDNEKDLEKIEEILNLLQYIKSLIEETD